MPRDVFRVVLNMLMPSWDPLRRGGVGDGGEVRSDWVEWRKQEVNAATTVRAAGVTKPLRDAPAKTPPPLPPQSAAATGCRSSTHKEDE